ncbi:MAG TPA: tetratricopeptide repeat protein [Chloroflexota bacterium]|nr:tetratricopeptide repeat protein [Chloroflexota bacterium]
MDPAQPVERVLDASAPGALAGGDSPHAIQVYALGSFRVFVHGDALGDDAWHRKKARQLFKLLLSRLNRRAAKDEVIELLWPESDPETGSTNLRSAIHAMRRALGALAAQSGGALVVADRDSVWLRSDADVWLDADEFEQTLEQARHAPDPMALLRHADVLYAGDYLPEDLYEDWAAERRDNLKRAWSSLQFQLAQQWESRGDADAAARAFQRLLRADPCDERAARELMGLLTRHGRRSEAIRVYQRLVRALREDLDVDPSQITTVLFETEVPRAHDPAPAGAAPREHPEQTRTTPRSPAGVSGGPSRLHNLLAQPGVLVGRGQESAAAQAQLLRSDVRLLTFLGPAGCGKTRLAMHVANELLFEFADGVWFVDLSVVRDADRIVFAIGRTLEVAQPVGGQSYAQRLIQTIADNRVLLVLDNFEQVVSGGPQVAELVAGCPNLKVLVTSREPLHVRWEHEFQVPPLAAPRTAAPASLAAVRESPAVTLFVQRAHAIKPEWRLSDANAGAVAELCVRLDGLPLAIELAAARIKLFTPEAMLARMDRRLELLTGASRDVPERHRGLRLAIEWSHNLLSRAERAAFRGMAVFAGGWTLDAAIDLCTEPAGIGPDVLEQLEALADKSLLRVELQLDGEPRFSMLETVREFALAELAKSGELAATQQRHALWCVRLVETVEPELSGPRQVAYFEQLEREHDNLRAALRWSFDGGDPLIGVRLAAALGRFWEIRGYLQEAHQWLTQAVGIRYGVPPATRAKVCTVAGHVAFLRGEYDAARTLLEESVTLSRGAADAPGVVQALINLALVAMTRADTAQASALLHESLDIAGNLADNPSVALSLNLLGQNAYYRGELAEAHSLLERSLDLRRAEGNRWGTAQALCDLGQVCHAEGFAAVARDLHAEGLAIWRDLSDVWGLAYALEGFAVLFGARSPERAVRLVAVATAARDRVGIRPLPGRETNLQQTLGECARALGDDAYAAAWAAGRASGLDAAIDDVLETVT